MYLPPPRRPKFWKAFVATAIFVFPLSLLARLVVHVSDAVWLALAIVITAAFAVLVHLRVTSNWLDQDSQRFRQFEERASISPDLRKR